MLKKKGTLIHPVERTLLHGEFVYGTEWAKDHPAYYDKVALYGAEMIRGKDVTHYPMSEVRKQVERTCERLQLESIERGVFMVEQFPLDKAQGLWDLCTDYEGLVFKNDNEPWGSAFGRMKRDAQMDYVCLGFESSDSDRHAGWGVASVIGGLIYPPSQAAAQACLVSGLNDEQRRAFYDDPRPFIGRVFTAEGKKVTKKGALRHPNFVRWRPDKEPGECIWRAR